jgi:hypothetical protein
MNLQAIGGALSALATTLFLSYAAPAQAGADDGVHCPSGYTSNWNAQTQVLRCSKPNTTWVVTICSPATPAFTNYVVRDGRDICTLPNMPVVGNLAPNQFSNAVCSVGGYTYDNDGGQGDRDRCTKTETQYAYPNQL